MSEDFYIPWVHGEIGLLDMPYGLRSAILTALYEDTDRDALARLLRGFRRLTFRGVARIARKHTGCCRMYVHDHWAQLSTLRYLLNWHDGAGETRRRILRLAWKKGRKS